MNAQVMDLSIVDYQPEYQPYFERLNKAWLEEFFTIEPLDQWVLERPEEAILAKGGKIYFALSGDDIVGTVALRFIADGIFEMTKMAVGRNFRGGGAGKLLCQTAISKSRELGAGKLILFSNRVLKDALHIYKKANFKEIPVEPGTYHRADIMMEINFNQHMAITAFTEQEIQQFRAETAGTAKVIHFNNAGAALPPNAVLNTVTDYLRKEATCGGYETEAKYQPALDGTYDLIARLINAHRDEIAVLESASVAWGLVFNGIDFKEGDEIITSEMEYVTNLMGFLNMKKSKGVVFKVVPNDADGNFSLTGLEEAISNKTKLIAITHIPSTAGGMMPIKKIGKVARKHGILYLVDACQSAGQVPLDVQAIGCDMLSVTGRKYLRAPRGTGFLYVRKQVQDKIRLILMDSFAAEWVSETDFKLRSDARRFELYEKNRALTLGLGRAVEYALDIGVDRIWQRVQYLADRLRTKLCCIQGVTVHDFGAEKCGIVTFSVEGMESPAVKAKLSEQGINVSLAKAISTLIYMNKNHLVSIVRASVHYYNTDEEIDKLCEALS